LFILEQDAAASKHYLCSIGMLSYAATSFTKAAAAAGLLVLILAGQVTHV
jgi:hypothetical protein